MKRITGYFIIGIFSLIALIMYILYLMFNLESLMYFIILIILFLVFFISFFVLEVLIPWLNEDAKTKLTISTDAFDYLYNEFEDAKVKKEIGSALRIAIQLRHFYNCLSEKDKKNYQSRMNIINSYS